ncbi:tRNA pseudouridine(38-40) synthase TruA [Maribacter sp. 2304DJ31-5]|uniref:tRNA pseudouridine(38-40) synthase TruA n=1 Tax=Maribacter sp. 2304DJ31-5 TaxID=3386273 RepID=UPI0039BCCE0E
MRYFIQFSYFGQAYHGWQNQPNAVTVQSVLEDTLSKLLRSKIEVVGAGRTDAGVHAKEMFAHFDFDKIDNGTELIYRLNSFLPKDIAVQKIIEANNDAHARFAAASRSYEYWVCNHKNPFYKDTAHFVKQELDLEAMNRAAILLMGRKDFECFSKTNSDVKTFICNVTHAEWSYKEDLLVFKITADRFLRNMVRAIVGTLLDVGRGRYSIRDVNTIIKSKDRSRAGASVPAKGLYLTSVVYPNTIFKNG